jgi:hypothetical protein
MTAGVYAIVNTANGRVYVGSSVNVEVRWSGRRGELKRGVSKNKSLQGDWLVSQGTGFEFRILEVTSDDEAILQAAEDRWIKALRESESGVYNIRGAHVGRNIPRTRPKRRGWSWVKGSRKAHYFFKTTVTLCGKFQVRYCHGLEDFNHGSPANCAACRKAYVLLPPRRSAPRRPRGGTDG